MSADDRALTPLREALERLSAATQTLRHRQMPDMQGSARAVEQLGAAGTPPRPPDVSALDRARRSILAAAPTGTYSDVPLREMREAVWLLWTREKPLAGLPGLLDEVVKHADRQMSAQRKLIQAWLLGFDGRAPAIEAAGRNIRDLLARTSDARLDKWRAANGDFGLFDVRTGPSRVATAIRTSQQPVETILQGTGLDDPMQAGGGYARAVQTEVLAQFAATPPWNAADLTLDRCLTFLSPKGRLRFEEPEARGSVARGLLTPWLRTGPIPPDEMRATVQTFLLRHLKDPRLHSARWREAGPDATNLMRRWLDIASFEAFFALIGEYSPQEQFEYRKAFWSAYIEHEGVSRIRIALGSQIHSSARAVRELDGAYARLTGANGLDAVLLMQAGETVLCEWSRVGALRAWSRSWKNAPQLDQAEYFAGALRTKSLDFPPGRIWHYSGIRSKPKGTVGGIGLWHGSPDKGYWQSSAAEFMARHTGVLLGPYDWMPR